MNNPITDGANEPTTAPTTTPQLTPAEVTYLITTKFLPMAEITDPDILAAAKNIRGDGTQIRQSTRVVMSGLIALRDEGSISLEYVMEKKLMFKSHHVQAARTGDSRYAIPDIEGGLFGFVEDAEPQKLSKVVGKWFGPSIENPAGKAIVMAWNRLTEKGLVSMEDEEVARGKLDGVLSGSKTKVKKTPESNPTLIAQVLPQVVQWSKRWNALWSDETELATHLFGEIKGAIEWKKKSADSDD